MELNVIELGYGIAGGLIIGAVLLLQLCVNSGVGKLTHDDSKVRATIAYMCRIGAAFLSFSVLVIVVRMIRASTTVTILSTISVITGLLIVLYFGRKKIFNLLK